MAGVWDYGNEDDIEPLQDSSGETQHITAQTRSVARKSVQLG